MPKLVVVEVRVSACILGSSQTPMYSLREFRMVTMVFADYLGLLPLAFYGSLFQNPHPDICYAWGVNPAAAKCKVHKSTINS